MLFVQVKGTRTALGATVSVSLPPAKKTALARIPGPTYVAGVHEPSRRTFIRAVFDPAPPGVYDIPVANELTPAKLRVLYDEVKAFWKGGTLKPQQSQFA